jgi:hypothetical protein
MFLTASSVFIHSVSLSSSFSGIVSSPELDETILTHFRLRQKHQQPIVGVMRRAIACFAGSFDGCSNKMARTSVSSVFLLFTMEILHGSSFAPFR